MLNIAISADAKQLITRIAAADVVKVDDRLYTFIGKVDLDPASLITSDSKEDHEVVFETEFHTFNWWEVVNDSVKLNEREWQIGTNVLSFYSIQPI